MTTLGDLCEIKVNFPEADFWLGNKFGSIGVPTKTFSVNLIGIKVVATDKLVPQYLYYWFEYIQGRGLFNDITVLRPSDVKTIEIVAFAPGTPDLILGRQAGDKNRQG